MRLHQGPWCSSRGEMGLHSSGGGVVLCSSNVQGGFRLVATCRWLHYLHHGDPL